MYNSFSSRGSALLTHAHIAFSSIKIDVVVAMMHVKLSNALHVI